jgi:hypothetical protein
MLIQASQERLLDFQHARHLAHREQRQVGVIQRQR